jgi:hypothetical protein
VGRTVAVINTFFFLSVPPKEAYNLLEEYPPTLVEKVFKS